MSWGVEGGLAWTVLGAARLRGAIGSCSTVAVSYVLCQAYAGVRRWRQEFNAVFTTPQRRGGELGCGGRASLDGDGRSKVVRCRRELCDGGGGLVLGGQHGGLADAEVDDGLCLAVQVVDALQRLPVPACSLS